MTASVPEETLRVPGGVQYDEPLATAYAQGTTEPFTVRAGSQHTVEARVPGEYGRFLGFGAHAAQPFKLLRVGEYETVHERLAIGQEPIRRQTERRLPAPGS
ncbi:hypothetical protein, partial [Streptomyces sp. ISL-87]|uniref:hypothetical protein n=1 Tax=Streptomyces sp. ISL-87 TaxID=2819188 RepID=UPI002034C35B